MSAFTATPRPLLNHPRVFSRGYRAGRMFIGAATVTVGFGDQFTFLDAFREALMAYSEGTKDTDISVCYRHKGDISDGFEVIFEHPSLMNMPDGTLAKVENLPLYWTNLPGRSLLSWKFPHEFAICPSGVQPQWLRRLLL